MTLYADNRNPSTSSHAVYGFNIFGDLIRKNPMTLTSVASGVQWELCGILCNGSRSQRLRPAS